MPRFRYTAINQNGAHHREVATAGDVRQLIADLRRAGLVPTHIDALDEEEPPVHATTRRMRLWPGRKRTRRQQVMVFTRQLATLLRAGMPLVRGLEVLARQETVADWHTVLTDLGARLRSGESLSEAVARHPRLFDRLYSNMLKAGETSGTLAEVLDRLAVFLEKSHRLRIKIRTAMVYPLLVIVVAVVIVAGLLVWVVPKFELIFADLLKGAPLPWLTQMVITLSRTLQTYWVFVLGVLLVFGFVMKWRLPTASQRVWSETIVANLPVLGELSLKDAVARLSRTLGTLLASGVPILNALQITREACAHRRIANALGAVQAQVKAGASVAATFSQTQVFPPLVVSLVEVGEHTGELPVMLGRIADIYDEEVEQGMTALTSLIEPLLILVLALIVGTIVIALFLPIVRIVQLLT